MRKVPPRKDVALELSRLMTQILRKVRSRLRNPLLRRNRRKKRSPSRLKRRRKKLLSLSQRRNKRRRSWRSLRPCLEPPPPNLNPLAKVRARKRRRRRLLRKVRLRASLPLLKNLNKSRLLPSNPLLS